MQCNGDDRRPKDRRTRRHAPAKGTACGRHAPPWPVGEFFDTATPILKEILFWTHFSTGAKPKSASKAFKTSSKGSGNLTSSADEFSGGGAAVRPL